MTDCSIQGCFCHSKLTLQRLHQGAKSQFESRDWFAILDLLKPWIVVGLQPHNWETGLAFHPLVPTRHQGLARWAEKMDPPHPSQLEGAPIPKSKLGAPIHASTPPHTQCLFSSCWINFSSAAQVMWDARHTAGLEEIDKQDATHHSLRAYLANMLKPSVTLHSTPVVKPNEKPGWWGQELSCPTEPHSTTSSGAPPLTYPKRLCHIFH